MEQKPGKDFYGSSTGIVMLMIVYVFMYFDSMFVTTADVLPGSSGSNNIFSGNLSLILLFLSIVIILERYISRADVKVKLQDKNLQ